jgi:hypothetical protein
LGAPCPLQLGRPHSHTHFHRDLSRVKGCGQKRRATPFPGMSWSNEDRSSTNLPRRWSRLCLCCVCRVSTTLLTPYGSTCSDRGSTAAQSPCNKGAHDAHFQRNGRRRCPIECVGRAGSRRHRCDGRSGSRTSEMYGTSPKQLSKLEPQVTSAPLQVIHSLEPVRSLRTPSHEDCA